MKNSHRFEGGTVAVKCSEARHWHEQQNLLFRSVPLPQQQVGQGSQY